MNLHITKQASFITTPAQSTIPHSICQQKNIFFFKLIVFESNDMVSHSITTTYTICHSRERGNPLNPLRSWIPASAGYVFSQGKAIAIPINNNYDEVATQWTKWKIGGSLKAIGFGDGHECRKPAKHVLAEGKVLS
jgi:hypothetical protein